MYWYYGTKTTEAKRLNGSSAEGVYNNAVYAKTNAKINVIKKGRIKDTTVLVPGMGPQQQYAPKELVMKHLLSREFREIRNKSDTHEEWIRELMENMNAQKNQK